MSNRRRTWIFDLDNTLHDALPHIFPSINQSMTAYLAEHLRLPQDEASALRVRYWKTYGATLLGMMRHHGTDPHHFLHHTHHFPRLAEMVVAERGIRDTLRRLPGRKVVFSNAPERYAKAVLSAMGVEFLFQRVFSIEHMRFCPKPSVRGFMGLIRDQRLTPSSCIMVEDSLENLRTAKGLGMRTVWISAAHRRPAYVDLRIRSILELPRHLAQLQIT
jgi:putative hydrolase of the HAD superfamily